MRYTRLIISSILGALMIAAIVLLIVLISKKSKDPFPNSTNPCTTPYSYPTQKDPWGPITPTQPGMYSFNNCVNLIQACYNVYYCNPKYPNSFETIFKNLSNKKQLTLKENMFKLNLTDIGIIFTPKNDLVIIAFRGTESIWEWLKDFDAPQDNFTFGNTSLLVHKGIGEIYKALRTQISSYLNNITTKPQIVVMGHSLGAALCQMVALDLALQGYPIHLVCAIAPPRWASRNARDTYKSYNLNSYGVINTNDIVPSLPLQFMPEILHKEWYCYSQIGTIDESSKNKMILFDYDKCTIDCVGEENCDDNSTGTNPVELHHNLSTYEEGMKTKYFPNKSLKPE